MLYSCPWIVLRMEVANLFEHALQTVTWVASVLISKGFILILETMERKHSDWDETSVTQLNKFVFMAPGPQVFKLLASALFTTFMHVLNCGNQI